MNTSKDVLIYDTGLTNYSDEWDQDAFPEGEAMSRLCHQWVEATGQPLFAGIITPGDSVVVKPNLVRDFHPDEESLYSIITHPSIIRAVIDEIYRCLQGDGRIVIADAPMGDCDFQQLGERTGIARLSEYYWRKHGFEVELVDLRQYAYHHESQSGGYSYEVRSPLPGDPAGYREVDLAGRSAFANLAGIDNLEGTDVARRRETIHAHSRAINKYLIARTILDSNVLVSVPKLKVHSKVGITVNCKGMVGINGDKNLLPHFRWGGPSQEGDQFPEDTQTLLNRSRMRLGRFMGDHFLSRDSDLFKWLTRMIQSTSGGIARIGGFDDFDPVNGDWPGNDTCWRLAADLIRVALYTDRDGIMRSQPQRRFISLVDGIIAGESNGPLRPKPRTCGMLIAGHNPVSVDIACANLMGIPDEKIKYLLWLRAREDDQKWAMGIRDTGDFDCHSNVPLFNGNVVSLLENNLAFMPPRRWENEFQWITSLPT